MSDTKKNQTTEETATVKKAMISQPMAGKTDEEIAATRDLAVAKLRQMGYRIDYILDGFEGLAQKYVAMAISKEGE